MHSKNWAIFQKYIHYLYQDEQTRLQMQYNLYFCGKRRKSDLQKLLGQIILGTYEHDSLNQYRIKIEEEDNFATCPLEIEEGVLECKCGSKRTISFQKQTRSADEGSTTFAKCVECGTQWRFNN